MEKDFKKRGETLFGSKVSKCFYYSKNMLLIALIPTFVALMFGLELAVFRFIFPKGGSKLLTLLGWISLSAGVLGLFLIVYKLLNPKPFLVVTEKGLFANVILGKGGYLFFPWEEILDISKTAYRTSPVDTSESALMTHASYDDYVILKLTPHFKQPKFMVQTYDFGEDQLGLAVNMVEGKIDDIVQEIRTVWNGKMGRKE